MPYAKEHSEKAESEVDAFNLGVLRILWRFREATKTSSGLFCPWDIPDFVSNLPQELAPSIRDMGQRIEEDEELCDMWQDVCAAPFEESQDVQQKMLKRIREAQCNQTLDCIERVDRIKCLGNAVVPQAAQVVWEMILEMEQDRRAREGKDNKR